MKKITILAAATAAILPISISTVSNVAADDFFKNRQLVLTIASRPGGGFNAYGRTLAKHFTKHLGQKSSIIVKNMPGAGGRKATAWLAKIAPKDGSNLLGTMPGSLVEPILGDPKRVKYNPLKFGYVGSASGFTTLCLVRHEHPAKSFKDMMKTQVIMGGDQMGSTTHDQANMFRNLVGAKIKLVKGYSGTKTLVLAVQQKEIDGFCGYAWASLMSRAPHLIKDKIVRLVIQFGLDPHPAATDAGIPPVWDFVKDKKNIEALKLLASTQTFGRPYIVPANVPKARLAALRDAFDATMKDPAFKKDMTKRRLSIQPTSGAKVQKLIENIYHSDAATQKLARWAISKSE